MPRQAQLPRVFAEYAPIVHYVQRVSPREYSSTCPKCGGDLHQDHSWPDRCRWFVDDKPLGWCRVCGTVFWPDKAREKMSPEDFAAWRQEQIRQEEARKRSAERALAHLRSEQTWLRYHETMGEVGRTYWEGRGIPRGWQGFWQFGWCTDQHVTLPNGYGVITPSATIPLFNEAGELMNVKHRLVRVNDPGFKYRYELAGQGQPPFLCNLGEPIAGDVIAVEGEIKAAVTFATLDESGCIMVGLPGKSVGQAVVDTFTQAERVTIIMDPDAESDARQLAQRIGAGKCRILIPHAKIDDAILAGDIDRWGLRRWLRQARSA